MTLVEQRAVLLLNASNMATHPIYPYAFIQVPAIARQVGIEVICRDLLDVQPPDWPQVVQSLIERHKPSMILITLRNTDSLIAKDYGDGGSNADVENAYFPIERTRELIAAIRAISNLKIAVGGFGFSVLPRELMHHLQPDFGVWGAPDGFFAHFDDILQGNPSQATNLLYFQADQLMSTPRVLFPPLAHSEYTGDAIREMMTFSATYPSPGFKGAPVEIIRGCCHSCVFCSEPLVTGSQVRYREPSVVMKDIERLVDHGITHIYMISSELNAEGNEYILQLADRIRAFNQEQMPEHQITWFGANYLLAFSADDYQRLHRSGFTGGWFDITALDDENAKAMRTPYRNADVIPNLKTHMQFSRWQLETGSQQTQATSKSTSSTTKADPARERLRWTMFLGNPATTVETIRKTLYLANREGLAQGFDDCFLIPSMRVFDYEAPTDAVLSATYSVTTDLTRIAYNQRLPSFAFPPALLEHFGSEEAVSAMFSHVAETYLSSRYRDTRNWANFIKQRISAATISVWMTALARTERSHPDPFTAIGHDVGRLPVDALFADAVEEGEEGRRESLARQIVNSLVSACLAEFPDCLAPAGIVNVKMPFDTLTPYRLAVAFFGRWSTDQEVRAAMLEPYRSFAGDSRYELLTFCIGAVMYNFNVQMRPDYKELFVASQI